MRWTQNQRGAVEHEVVALEVVVSAWAVEKAWLKAAGWDNRYLLHLSGVYLNA